MGRPKGSKNKPKIATVVAGAAPATTVNEKINLPTGTTSFLGVYESFDDIVITPTDNDTAVVDYAEYIYSNSSWHKINYLGTYMEGVFPSDSPNEYDLIGQVPSTIEYPFTIVYKLYFNNNWVDFSNFRLTLNFEEINN